MKGTRAPRALFWIIQSTLLLISILYLSREFSTTPRGAFLTPSFRSVFSLLLFWGPVTKIPALLGQFVLINTGLWKQRGRLVRVALFYLTDLACSILAILLLFRVWIGTLFIDASFPLGLALVPHSLLSGLLLAWLGPAPASPVAPKAEKTMSPRAARERRDPVLAQLTPAVIVLAALVLTGGFAASISDNGFDLAGQSLGFFPFMLLISRIYFDPALAAFRRTPHSADRVFLVNLLTGWTVVGWAACLLWARLPSPTVAQEKKAIAWRTSAGLAVSGIGMVLTGISVGVLGASLTESPTGSMGEHVAPLLMLVLCVLVLSAGLGLVSRSVDRA